MYLLDMYGKDKNEATVIDEVLGSIDDIWLEFRKVLEGEDDEQKVITLLQEIQFT